MLQPGAVWEMPSEKNGKLCRNDLPFAACYREMNHAKQKRAIIRLPSLLATSLVNWYNDGFSVPRSAGVLVSLPARPIRIGSMFFF